MQIPLWYDFKGVAFSGQQVYFIFVRQKSNKSNWDLKHEMFSFFNFQALLPLA